jgi:hypothetical protein
MSLVGMKWLVIQDLEPILQCPKCPFDYNPQRRVPEVEQFSCILRAPNSILPKMISCPTISGRKPGQPASTRKNFPRYKEREKELDM